MIYGYIRVSSDKQTVENQRFEINNFCTREGIRVEEATLTNHGEIQTTASVIRGLIML